MSSTAYSITFVTDRDRALANVSSVADGGELDYEGFDDSMSLLALSRNGHLEQNLRLLLDALGSPSLTYFRTRASLDASRWEPFAAALADDALVDAASALRAELVKLRDDPSHCLPLSFARQESPDDMIAVLAEPWPSSIAEASARVADGEDGESFRQMIASLHGHLLVLEEAVATGRAVTYFMSMGG